MYIGLFQGQNVNQSSMVEDKQDIAMQQVVEDQPQIYKGDPRTCAIFILAWSSNWGSSSFSCNQNNRGSSGAYMSPASIAI